jgi:hypothetical protein
MTITMGKPQAGPPQKSTMCLDEALQRDMMAMGMGMSKEMCAGNEWKREGARYVGNSECKIGESKIVAKSVTTVTGDTGYRTEVDARYEPPLMGMKEGRTIVEGKYAGPCRDGMKPGDVIGPNGQKFNMRSFAAGQGAATPSPQPARPPKAQP